MVLNPNPNPSPRKSSNPIQIQIHRIWQKWLNPDLNPNPDLDLPTIDMYITGKKILIYLLLNHTILISREAMVWFGLQILKVKGPTENIYEWLGTTVPLN